MDFPENCPQCHLEYVELGSSCPNCGYPKKDSIILHKITHIETMLETLTKES